MHVCIMGVILAGFAMAQPEPKSTSQPKTSNIDQGEIHFRTGHFEKAITAYKSALSNRASVSASTLRLGEIALLSNQLDQAAHWLTRARELPDVKVQATKLLAETYHRKKVYSKAASLFRESGRGAFADLLTSFEHRTPYDIDPKTRIAEITFESVDPLPVIQGRVNDSEPVNFIIDTGAGHVILDPEFADKVGAVRFGAEASTFGGDKKAESEHARIDQLQLGNMVVANLPVRILGTRRFAAAAGGKQIDGVIGTLLFHQFLATLDYPNGRLVLRTLDPTPVLPKQDFEVPFWLAGDHLMVAQGRANDADPCLMFVDTGLAGSGFTCPESTIKAAGVDLSSAPMFEGMSGGGPIQVRPFKLDRLSLGDIVRENITSLAGPFPESLEYGQGFQICGLVSHSFFQPFAVTFDFRQMLILIDGKP